MKSETFCIVGLGNPNKKYQKTRHNVGFRIVEHLASSFGSDNFSFSKRFNADITEMNLKENKALLVKPQTFMNRSGLAIHSVLDYYKIPPENLLVVHDDLDLPFGKIRFSKDSSPAGHNGVKSIIQQLGTKNFTRLRFGISDSSFETQPPQEAEIFVLKNFSEKENANLADLISRSSKSIAFYLENNFTETTNKYN